VSKAIRSIILYGWFLCAVLLSLSSNHAVAQPVRSALSPEIEIVDIEGFGFPRHIAGMLRNQKIDYKVPGLGFSVFYGRPGDTWADIYIYDKRLDLTSGSPLHLARKELESAIGDVEEHVKMGNYQSAVIQGQSTSGLFAKAHVKIKQNGKERDSFVFITVNKGKFVKIRLTSSAGAAADRIAQNFLSEYNRVLSNP
jgi:hypothetical protein